MLGQIVGAQGVAPFRMQQLRSKGLFDNGRK